MKHARKTLGLTGILAVLVCLPFRPASGAGADNLSGAAGLLGKVSAVTNLEDSQKASFDAQTALMNGAVPEGASVAAPGWEGAKFQASGLSTQGKGKDGPVTFVPEPRPSGHDEDEHGENAPIYRKYMKAGAAAGRASLGILMGLVGYYAGLPSPVGAASALVLFMMGGMAVGKVAGRRLGHSAATARIALAKAVEEAKRDIAQFAKDAKEYGSNLKEWFGDRPHWGQPYPKARRW